MLSELKWSVRVLMVLMVVGGVLLTTSHVVGTQIHATSTLRKDFKLEGDLQIVCRAEYCFLKT